jgi:cytochrome c556
MGLKMNRNLVLAIIAVVVIGGGVYLLNQDAEKSIDTAVIKQRIELMRKDVLGNFKVVKAYVKDGKGSMADIETAAKGIQAAAGKIPALFPKGTGRPDVDDKTTRSLAKIWDDWGTFEKAAQAMGAHAGHIAMYAAQENADEVKKHFGLMGKEGCGACHKPFRGPKAEK